ncbi:MAG: DMT family transporter, partial [Gammaproteobacteria bacterium]
MNSPASVLGRSSRRLQGILLVAAAVTSFSVLDSFAKHLSQTYPVPLVIWARYFFHVAIMVALLWRSMGVRLLRTHRLDLQVMRGLVLGLSTAFFVSGLSMMPLAEASAITQIAPVLLTLMAVRVLGEQAPSGTWWALGVSFCGVLLIVRPGGQVFSWVAVLPLLTALCSAGYQLLTRKLAGIDDGLATLFIGAVVATALLTLAVPWFWEWPRSWFDASLFLGMGAVGAFSHLLLVRAFERAPASLLAPFIYLQVVGALAMGLFIFGDFPDLTALAGIALIALTGVTMAWRREAPGAAAVDEATAEARPMPGPATGMALDGVPALVSVTVPLPAAATEAVAATGAGAAAGAGAVASAGFIPATEPVLAPATGRALGSSEGQARATVPGVQAAQAGALPLPSAVVALPAPLRAILLVVGAC